MMSGESRNEVDQSIHNNSHFPKNEIRIESMAPSVDSTSAQQPGVDRDRNEGQGDLTILQAIVEALKRVEGATPVVVHVSVVRWAPIKELRRYGTTKFLSLKGVDPLTFEVWLESTK